MLAILKAPTGRYYSWQMLNGWGETVLNINERTFPDHPFGKYALVLKGSNPPIPEDALRVDPKPQEPCVGACRIGFQRPFACKNSLS